MRPEEALASSAADNRSSSGILCNCHQLKKKDRGDRLMEGEEIDEEEIVDNEVILDLALAEFRASRSVTLALPFYRATRVQIAFSNRQFYQTTRSFFHRPSTQTAREIRNSVSTITS